MAESSWITKVAGDLLENGEKINNLKKNQIKKQNRKCLQTACLV